MEKDAVFMDKRKNSDRPKEPTVAPGYSDRKFGEKASKKDIESGNSTRVTRVYLDENDPS